MRREELILFSCRLVLARRAAGLTQRELAREVGVSPALVGMWECARTCPSAMNLARAARALQMSPARVDWLLRSIGGKRAG